ncbi:splicing factor hnRNP-F, putative [Ixodes scapularis]|uniref:Splicing factor hnRNP-F, putative n=1 Tax=Ixodes scapularis TaxID=6945 RepID=B7PJS9_IXOSC|nr:splicing factor hnRNP-F, putative [Ixodes scapularis]|eukprot:XP_002408443.1 splicing factor hnRNP-F, putative [Ixodes scapularis]
MQRFVQEILNFFTSKEVNIKGGISGVHMTLSREGRPSGEAYIELESEQDVEVGLQRHNEHIGHRYIEVFKSKRSEMDWVVKRSGAHQQDSLNDGCVRLRGLPFGCSKEEIAQFFSGFVEEDGYGDFGGSGGARYSATGHFVHMRGLPFRATERDIFEFFQPMNPMNVHLIYEDSGRPSGECDVEFATHEEAVKAMSKDKAHMQHRYIELFLNSTPSGMSAGGSNGGGAGFGNGVGPIGSGAGTTAFGGTMAGGGSGFGSSSFGSGRYGGKWPSPRPPLPFLRVVRCSACLAKG